MFRSASVKEFEVALEQSDSLLKKRLRSYFAINRLANRRSGHYILQSWEQPLETRV